jgi:membrane-bound metal-dependent hydrolase YbcI (DUF457 family)
MTPWGHAAVGLGMAGVAAAWGWRAKLPGLLLGSVLPDIDFVLLVPLLGRQRGHRTITHAPVFQLWLAWRLRRMGFWSLLVGQLAHCGRWCGGGWPLDDTARRRHRTRGT